MKFIEIANINNGRELVRVDLIESVGLPMDPKFKDREQFWQGWVRLTSGRVIAFASAAEAVRVINALSAILIDSGP